MNEQRIYEKVSYLTGKTNRRNIVAPAAEWARFDRGETLIQDALRSVSKEDREFLITGSTPEEWAELEKEGEDL